MLTSVENRCWVLLAEDACEQPGLVGAKARNVARLERLGLPVPSSFCLTVECYRTFVKSNGLDQVLESALARFGQGDPASRVASAETIRRGFLNGIIPTELVSEIEHSFNRLVSGTSSGCRVAVRSSATAEDLPDASFAGAQSTFLNLDSLSAVLDAIRQCWASLWTERAISYRRRLGMDETDLALAIIIQRMVAAKVSGVVFTVEPVTGDRQRLVLEACHGLSEGLVSGTISPDHYEIDRQNLRILRRWRGSQAEVIVGGNGDGRKGFRRNLSQPDFCLDDERAVVLARLALRIEDRFGSPQDIEWAIGPEFPGGPEQVYILQARPITTLEPKQSNTRGGLTRWESPIPGAHWLRHASGLAEYLPTPPSPLYATAQLPIVCRMLDTHSPELGVETLSPTYVLINGYLYVRCDHRMGLATLLLPFRYWRGARQGAKWWRERMLPEQLAELAALSACDVSSASADQLIAHLEQMFQLNAAAWDTAVRASLPWVLSEPLFSHIFNLLIRPITGGEPVVFLRGFDSQTMTGERAYWALMQAALQSPEILEYLQNYPADQALKQLSLNPRCRQWLEDFSNYHCNYGHVTAKHDYLYPSLADDRVKAMEAFQTRIKMPAHDPSEYQKRLAAERGATTTAALEKLSCFPLRKALFFWALAWAQQAAAMREDVFFHALRGWPLARRAVLELGRRLVASGALSCPEDIFFLTWDEVQDSALHSLSPSSRSIVEQRRQLHEWRTDLSPPPFVPLDGPPQTLAKKIKAKLKRFLVGSSNESTDQLLRGAPVSPGTVTGPARIIQSAEDFGRLRNGDVLVTSAATPEWTPTFLVAAGLVTDAGGPLSHSSIVAREFGIPAVMGVKLATRRIADGQIVTIDGSLGLVRLH